jgi:hypothetical protein
MKPDAALRLEIKAQQCAVSAAAVHELCGVAVGYHAQHGALMLLKLMQKLTPLAAPHADTTILANATSDTERQAWINGERHGETETER